MRFGFLFIMMITSRLLCKGLRSFSLTTGITTSLSMSATKSSSLQINFDKPLLVSAPMVDHSELAFRLLVRQNGADLAFAQMMHSKNFITDPKYRNNCMDWMNYSSPSSSTSSSSISTNNISALQSKQKDRPLIVQLAGNDVDVLLRAGRLLHHQDITAIDLNLGCPQKIAKKGNYGAYLLSNKDLIRCMLTEMVTQLDCPITAKIRRLETEEETLELARMLQDTGISMLTVHGRTVHQNKLFTGAADWDMIRKIKDTVSIPVIANGGIGCYDDIRACLEATGADGVMSSEALLENPKLFTEEGDRRFREDYVKCQFETVDEYLSLLNAHPLPRELMGTVRSHLFPMLFRFVNAPAHLDLRHQLATGRYTEMIEVVEVLKQRLSVVDFNMEMALEKELISPSIWYMRHRTEEARSRILSRKRAIVRSEEKNRYITKKESEADISVRLQQLKQRLKNKREVAQTHVQ